MFWCVCVCVVLTMNTDLLRFELSELLTTPKHHVHVLVEGHECAHDGPVVSQCDPHPVVNILEHPRASSHRHDCAWFR